MVVALDLDVFRPSALILTEMLDLLTYEISQLTSLYFLCWFFKLI
jgi:hypothetical protein